MKFNSVQINMKQVSHNVTVVLYAMVLSFFKKIKCSQNVGPDLDPNCLTLSLMDLKLTVCLERFF